MESSEFSAYHMKCINRFKWTALARSIIQKDAGGYVIKSSPILAQLVFFVYFGNTVGKLVFLSLLVTDHFGEIEFLDKVCGLDYLLCGGMVIIAYLIWLRYPLYEVIYRLWEVENRIFTRLSSPRAIKWRAEEQHSITVWAHALLTCLGCCSLTIQFYMAPKYCVFTYSLLEMDTPYLRILFCFHEALFLSHAWFAMACSNGLCSFEAVNLSLIIKEMSKAVSQLENRRRMSYHGEIGDDDGNGSMFGGSARSIISGGGDGGIDAGNNPDEGGIRRSKLRRRTKKLESLEGAQLSRNYNLQSILYDFQQLMIVTEQFNDWVGYKIVGLSICAFCQYISSTCMAFQVLKIPGTGISDIWFYIQDCTVAVYVTFRVFDFMSVVLPASEDFMGSVRRYLAAERIVGGHISKFYRTLRPVSLKVGPTPLRREAVLDTMQMLASYYVCVALW